MSDLILAVFWIFSSIAMYVIVKKDVTFYFAEFWDSDECGMFLALIFAPFLITLIPVARLIAFIFKSVKNAIDWTFKIGEYEDRGNSYRF